MKGRVWVESKENIGSIFHFTMPLIPDPLGNQQSAKKNPKLTGYKVVVHSNDPSIVRMLATHFNFWEQPYEWVKLEDKAEPKQDITEPQQDMMDQHQLEMKDSHQTVTDTQLNDYKLIHILYHQQCSSSVDSNQFSPTSSPVQEGDTGRNKYHDWIHLLPTNCKERGEHRLAMQLPIKRGLLEQALLDAIEGPYQQRTPTSSSSSSPKPRLRRFSTSEIQLEIDEVDRSIGSQHPLKILVVEDNEINMRVVLHMLRGMQYPQVDTANNGVDAIKKVENQEYDLILMDVHMPLMDGVQTTKLIRRRYPRTYVCAVSADVLLDGRRKCFDAGMNDFLEKPITHKSLYNILHKSVQNKKAMPL